MKLYIDPGTGSMLFAILIGIIGAANYLIRKWIVKLRFAISGGKKEETNRKKLPFVIFSDDKRYWKNFEPICRELDKRGVEVAYMTASIDDPVLSNPYPHIHGEFIGAGNKAFAKLNFLNAEIVLATTPGLDVYQWKRSKDVNCYVHILHATNDVTLYRMFGTDYYDVLLLSGDYQINQVRELETMRSLPPKELIKVGLPYMDEMYSRLSNSDSNSSETKTVLLAPSWGASSIFARFGGKVIDELLKTDYHIIIRPHPQSMISEKEMMEKLIKAYPPTDRIEWNTDNDNFEAQKRADILISDYSGIVFEFALVYDKPVIYANTDFDKGPYDAWWISETPWTFTALPRIGEELTEDKLFELPKLIASCLDDPRYAENRQALRDETWAYRGEGAVRTVDYLVEKYQSLLSKKEGNTV